MIRFVSTELLSAPLSLHFVDNTCPIRESESFFYNITRGRGAEGAWWWWWCLTLLLGIRSYLIAPLREGASTHFGM